MESNIKTPEDAFRYLSLDFNDQPQVSKIMERHQQYTVTDYQLVIIAEALILEYSRRNNLANVWEANYDNVNQKKWYPWFHKVSSGRSSGFVYSRSHCGYVLTFTGLGSRFAFPTKEISDYFGIQFIAMHNIKLLILPKEAPLEQETIDAQYYKGVLQKIIEISRIEGDVESIAQEALHRK